MDGLVIFWAVLENGKNNSVSSTNVFEATRRARDLGAKNLFVFELETRTSRQIF